MAQLTTSESNIPVFKLTEASFNERQLSEILYSLEGKKELPRKYSYFEIGVERWLNRSINNLGHLLGQKTEGYDMFVVENGIISKTIDSVLGSIPAHTKVNVVDIGCGSGWTAFPILYFLKQKKQLSKYIAMDLVEEMCDTAITNLKGPNGIKGLKTDKFVHDFEDGHFADLLLKERKEGVINLFCFFSSTLGTMLDRHRALANIRDSMTTGDLLWVGNTLYNNAKFLEPFYNNMELDSDEYKFYLGHILAFFHTAGMNDAEFGKIVLRKSEDLGLLKYYFVISKPFILEIQNKKHIARLEYKAGDEIVLCRLKNYHESDLIHELKDAGFKLQMMNPSDDYRTALVLVTVN